MKKLFTTFVLLLSLVGTAREGSESVDKKKCPVIVIALVKVKPGTEQTFKMEAMKILYPTRKEKNNIQYTFNQSLQDTTTFDTYEKWVSVDDLQNHLQTQHMQNFFAKVGNLFEEGYPIIHTLKNIECK